LSKNGFVRGREIDKIWPTSERTSIASMVLVWSSREITFQWLWTSMRACSFVGSVACFVCATVCLSKQEQETPPASLTTSGQQASSMALAVGCG